MAAGVGSGAAIDVVIGLALLWVAWRALATPALFNAVVLFIVFGLLMTLAWARLAAPDIALAEAAIGAGLTGVLLLDAVAHLQARRRLRKARAVSSLFSAMVFLLVLGLGGALAVAVVLLPALDTSLRAHVTAQVPVSGVAHEVTAVLLNFRGYDTLLEIAVLLLAVLGVLTLRSTQQASRSEPSVGDPLASLVRVIAPLMVLAAGYLLWAGSHKPGGAFQAGSVLAAAGVLLRLTGHVPPLAAASARWRFGLVIGFAVFLAVAAFALANGRLLEYPPPWAGMLILLIEAALTVSIALILFTLFAAAPPPSGTRSR